MDENFYLVYGSENRKTGYASWMPSNITLSVLDNSVGFADCRTVVMLYLLTLSNTKQDMMGQVSTEDKMGGTGRDGVAAQK